MMVINFFFLVLERETKRKKTKHDIITQQTPKRKSLLVSTELSFEFEML